MGQPFCGMGRKGGVDIPAGIGGNEKVFHIK